MHCILCVGEVGVLPLPIQPNPPYYYSINQGVLLTKKLMSPDREIQLVRQLPDKKALDELVLANLGLIHKVCHRFPIKNASVTYDDLFQAGIEGLVHGILKFDVTRGYRLSTYVFRWISAYISRYFQNNGRTIRLPVHVSLQQMKLRKQTEALTKELGREPSAQEVRDNCDVNEDYIPDTISLNTLVSESEELEVFTGVDDTETNDLTNDVEILCERLRSEIDERDFDILVRRFGLYGQPEHTLNEIAEIHDLTRARVHQVEKQLLRQMRQLATA